MRNPSPQAALFALVLLLLAAVAPLAAEPPPEAVAGTPPLADHALKAQAWLTAVQAVIGPLPAVASTPFFALAGLTGLALFARVDHPSTSTLTALLRKNALVNQAGRYASPTLLVVLLALAMVGWLANSGKIQGTLGKIIRMAEDSSAVLAYLFLALATFAAQGPDPAPAIATAGMLDASGRTLLALTIAAGLAALMIVRFALDVLIWLTPVPLIDLAFETAKWAFTAGFAVLVLFYPRVAAGISLLAMLAALVVLRWALRLLRFAVTIALGGGSRALAEPLDLPAVVLAAPDLPSRLPGRLTTSPEGPRFVWKSWRGRSRARTLAAEGTTLELGRALLWLELRVVDPRGAVRERYALPRAQARNAERLRAVLSARDGAAYGLARVGAPGASPVAATTRP